MAPPDTKDREPNGHGQRVTFQGMGFSGSISGKDLLLILILAGSLGMGLWLNERRLDGLSREAGEDHERILRELVIIRDRLDNMDPRPAPRAW